MRLADRHILPLIALGFAIALPPDLVMAAPPPYRIQWGSQGSGDGQLLSPAGVAVDAAGNVYVADQGNNRVQKFSHDGSFLQKFGMGVVSSPIGVAIDSAGSIFVLEYWGHRVSKFDSQGVLLTTFGSFGSANGRFIQPRAIAVDGSGNVYVCDGDFQTVQKFTNEGTFMARWGSWGSSGSADGQFSTPWGVAADAAGSIYVGDTGNNRVQRLDSSTGAFVSKWGTPGPGDGQFNEPMNVAAATNGLVYVVDRANSRVQRFTAGGTFVDAWGSPGAGTNQFNSPLGVAVDAAGTAVYVADSGNHRIVAFGCSGPEVAPRLASMRAWWKLDEPTGTTAADLFGGATLSNVGTPTHNLGTLVNNSLKFTGATFLASATPGAAVDFGTGDYSLETWYRSADTTTPVRTLVDHRVVGRGYSLYVSFGHLGTQMADGTATNFTSSGASLNDGAWHHLVVSVQRNSANGGKLYVDGDLILTFNPTVRAGSLTNAGSFRLGQAYDNSSANLNGDLDEVALFTAALTAAEVQAAYCAGALGRSTSCGEPVAIAAAPAAVDAVAGTYVTLRVTATGTPPLEYRWEKNGVPVVEAGYISGSDTQELIFGRALVGDAGAYRVRVTNICGSSYSAVAQLTVCSPPTVSLSPMNQGVFLGETASITATSNGQHYQWRRGGVPVGTDSPTLTIGAVTGIDNGYYDVVVSNDCGATTSPLALIGVARCAPGPSLDVNYPENVDVALGSPASFSVVPLPVTDWCPPVTYQWLRNHTMIVGATSTTYTIPSTTLADAGVYGCWVVSNGGYRASRAATLNMAGPALLYSTIQQECTQVWVDWHSTPYASGKIFYGSDWHMTDSTEASPFQLSWNTPIDKPPGGGIYYHIRLIDQLGRATWGPNHYTPFPPPDPNTANLVFSPILYATTSDDFGPGRGVRIGMTVKNVGCESFAGLIKVQLFVGNATARDPATYEYSPPRTIVNGLSPDQSATMPVDLVLDRDELGPDFWEQSDGSRLWKGWAWTFGDGLNGRKTVIYVRVPPNGGQTP